MKKQKETSGRLERIINGLDRVFRWIKLKFTRSFRLLNRIKPPGFRGAGLFDVLNFFFTSMGNRHFTLYGAAMAFQFFFAVFPGLIFLFTLVPFIPVDGLQDKIEYSLHALVPGDALALVNSIVQEVFEGTGVAILSLNLVLTLYGSLNGIRAMMFAFSKHDHANFHQRSFLWSWLVAFVIFVILLIMLLSALTASVMGERLLNYMAEDRLVTSAVALFLIKILNVGVILLLLFAGISVIFFLAPETKSRWSLISPGSLLAGILFLVAVWLFKTVVIQVVNYSKFYGSLSAVMLLMFWFYWVSLMLLIGFELNAAIDKAGDKRKGTGGELILLPDDDVI